MEWSELLSSRGVRLGVKAGGVVLVLAIVGVAGWLWLRAEDTRGQVALAASTELVQQADGPQATADSRTKAIAALQLVLAQHGRSSAAVQAAYELGNLQFQAGDYAAARRAYELTLAKGASGSLRTLAASGVGYTWEAEKNYASAVTAYEAVARAVPAGQFFFEDAQLDLARAQALAGKPTEAVATTKNWTSRAFTIGSDSVNGPEPSSVAHTARYPSTSRCREVISVPNRTPHQISTPRTRKSREGVSRTKTTTYTATLVRQAATNSRVLPSQSRGRGRGWARWWKSSSPAVVTRRMPQRLRAIHSSMSSPVSGSAASSHTALIGTALATTPPVMQAR